MSRANWFVGVASAMLLLTIVLRASEPPLAPSALQAPLAPAGASEYLGSASCERCHQKAYAAWSNSLHIKMTKPVAEATVVGDFRDGTNSPITAAPTPLARKTASRSFRSRSASRPPETFSVDYTLGAKRYQGYLSTLPDGRIYVLPVFWHVADQALD